MRLKLSSSLEQLIQYCWLAAAFALPLACNPLGANIFGLPKFLILIILTVLLLTFTLLHLASVEPVNLPDDPPLFWTVLCWGLAAMGATVLASSLQDSLFGNFGRHQGLLTLLCYQVIMLSTAVYLRSQDQILLILRVLVWTSAPICLFGILQFFGYNPFDLVTDSSSPLIATFGRSNFFGAYLVLVLPLTIMLLVMTNRRWSSMLLTFLMVVQLVCLVLSHARSSWIGFGTAMLSWLLLSRIKPANHFYFPRFLPLLLAAAAAWVLAAFLSGPLDLEVPAGFAQLSETIMARGGSVAARLTIWQRSVDLLLERPWLGYGFDNIETVFSRSFPPELVYYQGRHVMVDRAHNLWLDLGLSSGLLGISTMAALFILAALRIYRNLQDTADSNQRLISLGLAAALIGHLADLQFSFDLTASAAIFWLLLGMILALARGLPTAVPAPSRTRTSLLTLGMFWLLLFSILFSLWPLQALQADRLFARASQQERSLPESIEDMEQAVRLQPRKIEYRLSLARLYSLSGNLAPAEHNLQEAWRLRPNDPWIMMMRGHMYSRLHHESPGYLDKAELAYRKAVKLAPDISSFHTVLAMTLIEQGLTFSALTELKEALRLDETDPVAYEQLARLHELLGNHVQAQEARRKAEHWTKHEQEKIQGTSTF